jgi:hypothetical protein
VQEAVDRGHVFGARRDRRDVDVVGRRTLRGGDPPATDQRCAEEWMDATRHEAFPCEN